MEKIIIKGGNKLFGNVEISSAKNACLPIISSCVMLERKIIILNVPLIKDVFTMCEIIKDAGGNYNFNGKNLILDGFNINNYKLSDEICKKARATFFVAGALLAKFKKAIMPLPGGCNIGKRPVDIHINAFQQLNVKYEIFDNHIVFDGCNMKSGIVTLPFPSVGATINVINASVFLKGQTTIKNCAKEPEIIDLCNFLNGCGCNINGAGSDEIIIYGVENKGGGTFEYLPLKDRIEAGTFMTAVSATGGEIQFEYDNPLYLNSLVLKLKSGGIKVDFENGKFHIKANKKFKNSDIVADVYPYFPTDMQPQYLALCLSGYGNCSICDNVFKNRFIYTNELNKMGAEIKITENIAHICGSKKLHGENVCASDLRGGASLVIASLIAEGQTEINNFNIVERGYERLPEKLKKLGADII